MATEFGKYSEAWDYSRNDGVYRIRRCEFPEYIWITPTAGSMRRVEERLQTCGFDLSKIYSQRRNIRLGTVVYEQEELAYERGMNSDFPSIGSVGRNFFMPTAANTKAPLQSFLSPDEIEESQSLFDGVFDELGEHSSAHSMMPIGKAPKQPAKKPNPNADLLEDRPRRKLLRD